MTISLTLYEDAGPKAGDNGTTRTIVENIGWKSHPADDETTSFASYPVRRPQNPRSELVWSFSYSKYHFFKFNGTYTAATRPRIVVTLGTGGGSGPAVGGSVEEGPVRVYLRLSDTYETPTNNWDEDGVLLMPGKSVTLYPKVSVVGPHAGLQYLKSMVANTTYYTQYLVSQLVVQQDYLDDASPYKLVGNIPATTVKFMLDEYESGDI